MYYNEAYEERQKQENALLAKWEKALEADGGISNEHLARTTAIVLENYLQYLHSDPRLIAEDRIETSAFTGVNLALLGLIARVIPNLIGAELVGIQAMPTPKAPIFTIKWEKDHSKGRSSDGDELWTTPVSFTDNEVGLDPHYSSQIVEEIVTAAELAAGHAIGWGNVDDSFTQSGTKPYLFNNTMYVTCYDTDGNMVSDYKIAGDLTSDIADVTFTSGVAAQDSADNDINIDWTAATRTLTSDSSGDNTIDEADGDIPITKIIVRYEYKGEAEPNVPEISFSISEQTVELIRRQLRGKYTMDAAYDLRKLHGINLDSELANMMKIELQAEINREIVGDLRNMAAISEEIDYVTFRSVAATNSVSIEGNYDDAHRVLLDAINKVAAKVWNVGRLGKANWLVGNPVTLAFLDRVPGFVGSGVSYNGRELSYMGSLGGRMKFYADPLYPKNEFLMGYKGPGALDSGYIHAPYLPITATPTMINPETGDPSKIFYTRYGKTFNLTGGVSSNVILNGEYQYARLKIKNLPSPLNI